MLGQNYYGNLITTPRWAADFGSRDHLEPWPAKLDAAQFTDQGGVQVALTGNAAQNATSIAVTALAFPISSSTTIISAGNVLIPAGTNLYFNATGKFARTTVDAKVGDTSIAVQALPTALVTGDAATYSAFNLESLPSGWFVGRTFAERDAGTSFGPATVTDDELFLIAFDKPNLKVDNDAVMYRHNSRVKENYLPQWTTLSTAAIEVQTVAVDTIMSGGKIGITAIDKNGVPQEVVVAYNTSWTQTVADIQTALNALLGTSAVAAAVVATHDMTLTFSGTGYTGISQPPVGVDISAATGPTKVTVTRTTAGGTALLTKLRSLYQCIKGTD